MENKVGYMTEKEMSVSYWPECAICRISIAFFDQKNYDYQINKPNLAWLMVLKKFVTPSALSAATN